MHAASTRTIVIQALILALILTIAMATPIALTAYADRSERIEQVRYLTGLSPCDGHWQEFSEYIDSHLPGPPDISIDEFPSFSNARAVRVVGSDVFFFRAGSKVISKYAYERADVRHSAISAETSAALVSLVTREIDNARAEHLAQIDGTTYVFRSARTNKCAKALSAGGARAGRFVDLYHSIIRHATGDLDHPVDEDRLQQQVSALVDD